MPTLLMMVLANEVGENEPRGQAAEYGSKWSTPRVQSFPHSLVEGNSEGLMDEVIGDSVKVGEDIAEVEGGQVEAQHRPEHRAVGLVPRDWLVFDFRL